MFPFQASLNASTLFPFKLNVLEQITVAAEAGYEGIELWVSDIEAFLAGGGTAEQIRECLTRNNVAFANAIAFFKWADADAAVRAEGFAQAERELRMLAELGCRAAAAPPFGDVASVSLSEMGQYYAELTALGREIGIDVYLEFWGKASNLSNVNEAKEVVLASGIEQAQVLLDPFHMYTGGSSVEDLKQLQGSQIGIVHANDYPAAPSREVITDAQRVFPGEGVAPLKEIAEVLYASGYRGFLSVELFIEDFGSLTAAEVASKGITTLKQAFQVEV
ncbi:sugar phosphate isomerase/epimerase family protein [Paenibacillus lignilyticus]|uniref:Sugar phosphate isomerase/epimerase n=1 Tax=Paenibacillus lignilyticus TaxID=1172615 RepID=A0ABS5CFS7_9BACL|nr:sugar phosphate isomerase/epimerase [Paenibacillus lignilyticus]MBP3964704.1 sugar phosphate isomerase/epimerase [Paenibacillus lignilyticus]